MNEAEMREMELRWQRDHGRDAAGRTVEDEGEIDEAATVPLPLTKRELRRMLLSSRAKTAVQKETSDDE